MTEQPRGLRRADARKILQLCDRAGWSPANLCMKAGIDNKTLERVLNGGARMSTIAKIAHAFRVPPDSLLEGAPSIQTQEPEGLSIKLGRFLVKITADKHAKKEKLRHESAKLADVIYTYCNLLDGWDQADLDPTIGSISFTLKLTGRDAKRLVDFFIGGGLARFNVISVAIELVPSTVITQEMQDKWIEAWREWYSTEPSRIESIVLRDK